MINAAEAYTYDGQNNLTSIAGDQQTTSTYTYDANGERLSKLNQTHTTQYYYDGVNLLFTKRNNSIDVRYLYDEGTLYAAIAADGLPYWYNVDLRGSVTNIIKGDTTGSITTSLNKSYVYDAYGNTDVTSPSGIRAYFTRKGIATNYLTLGTYLNSNAKNARCCIARVWHDNGGHYFMFKYSKAKKQFVGCNVYSNEHRVIDMTTSIKGFLKKGKVYRLSSVLAIL